MAVGKHSGTAPKPEDFAGAYQLVLKHPDYRELAPRFCGVLADYFANGGGDEAQLRARLTPEALSAMPPDPPMPLAAMIEGEGFARNYAILMRENPGDPALRQALTDELMRAALAGRTAAKGRTQGGKTISDRAKEEHVLWRELAADDPEISKLPNALEKAFGIRARLNAKQTVQTIRKVISKSQIGKIVVKA